TVVGGSPFAHWRGIDGMLVLTFGLIGITALTLARLQAASVPAESPSVEAGAAHLPAVKPLTHPIQEGEPNDVESTT
ncbi:MAG: hypothetical protein Q9O62_07750, partial [Ardenticatenia bacterium]|nr:hypothetical protein [Ardenticatenia bacterium]